MGNEKGEMGNEKWERKKEKDRAGQSGWKPEWARVGEKPTRISRYFTSLPWFSCRCSQYLGWMQDYFHRFVRTYEEFVLKEGAAITTQKWNCITTSCLMLYLCTSQRGTSPMNKRRALSGRKHPARFVVLCTLFSKNCTLSSVLYPLLSHPLHQLFKLVKIARVGIYF